MFPTHARILFLVRGEVQKGKSGSSLLKFVVNSLAETIPHVTDASYYRVRGAHFELVASSSKGVPHHLDSRTEDLEGILTDGRVRNLQGGGSSLLYVPVRKGGRVVGLFRLYSVEEEAFDEEDEECLEELIREHSSRFARG